MNIKAYFVNEESKYGLLCYHGLPSLPSRTPILYTNGFVQETEELPLNANALLQCVESGLLKCKQSIGDSDLFACAFSELFPLVTCYWNVQQVNMFKNIITTRPLDMQVLKTVAHQIYDSFVDDHYHTVAIKCKTPKVSFADSILLMSITDIDRLNMSCDRVEIFLPLIGIGNYFPKEYDSLTHIYVIVPRNNTIPVAMLRKRIEYCIPIKSDCKVELVIN